MFARVPFCYRGSFTFARALRFGGLAVAAVGLAACGSSTAKSASNPTIPNTATASTPSTAVKAVVMTSHSPKLGVIVVDAAGRTLYDLTSAGKPIACTGMCARVWPPLLLPAGATTPAGTNVTGLTVVAMNGGKQVALHGDPLYLFAGDTKAGDTNGQGIHSFGGTWHAATTSSAASSAPPTTPPTTSSGGYNYG